MIRVLSGLALALGFLALIWFLSSSALLGVALAVAALAFGEYTAIVEKIGANVPWWSTGLATVVACVMVPYPWLPAETVLGGALILIALNVLTSAREGKSLLTDAAAAMLAPVYIGLPLGALVAIHAIAGREALLLVIATIVVSDSAQYYAGRSLGRTPLAPRHSPKKTREGAIGGLVVAPIFLVVAGRYWMPSVPPATLAALGAGVAVAGMIGDLFESMLKRAADVKDSSHLIPGHGGILDRIDALIFAAPIFYFFVRA